MQFGFPQLPQGRGDAGRREVDSIVVPDTITLERIRAAGIHSGPMARHSKWHKVKQFKGAIDAKRSASFTKLAREITVAAKEKGGDPAMNARLRAAMDRARESSMPKDNIERAIQRGIGGGAEGQIDALTYEAYAPGGTGLVIECLTDNRNRTANDVKHLLSKNGGTLAASGAVTFGFTRAGVVHVPEVVTPARAEEMELTLIDAGATEFISDEQGVEVRCAPTDLAKVADAVAKMGCTADTVEFQWIPTTLVDTDEATANAVAELIDALEAHDDVTRVWSNLA